eukprot:GEMP01020413.1.p1 GENE.GEMP01020413.1~~GEMP01020413.1.p1  ORF type:complete len:672 (+),score=176.12 GEMP01020413.1:115-2130(+)
MAAQMKEIVQWLNAEPFNMELSLVAFDEKDSLELLEVLRKVLAYMDSKHEIDLREENPDATYQRTAEFLHILGYRCPYDTEFQQSLMCGDKKTVYPILFWLLPNLEQYKKRAYLANFCVNLDVPEEFIRDEQVYVLYQDYKELQGQFKTTHAHLEEQRRSKVSPKDIEREVTQLDAEREQLTEKIAQFRSRSAGEPGFQLLLQVTSMLRKEQEEEARLVERLHEQRQTLEQTEQMLMEKSRKKMEMRQIQSKSEGAEAMLKNARSENSRNRDVCQRLQSELEEKEERLRQLDLVMQEPLVTKADIEDLSIEIRHLEENARSLAEKVETQNVPDKRLSVYKQQSNLVAKKKDLVMKDKKVAEDEKIALAKQLSEREREYEQMKGHKFMKRDEFRAYAASLRDKSTKFKRLKAELNEMRHEAAVLLRTEQIVVARDPTPAGMRETEKHLEKTSMAKAMVDKAKGQTLEEISTIVQKINNLLKEKKNKLAPLIKSLRTVRQTYQVVETKYLEKKNTYDAVKTQVDQEHDKTHQEVQKLEHDVMMQEQKFHELNVMLASVDARVTRADKELRCIQGKERYCSEFASLGAVYSGEINKLEQISRELRKQQKEVKESYESNRTQRNIVSQLEELMVVKLRVAQQEAALSQSGHIDMYGGRTAVDVSSGAVNRMIISD